MPLLATRREGSTSSRHGQAPAPGGDRSHPRRRLQPHGRAGGRGGEVPSWRGLDNRAHYRPDSRGHEVDFTGRGNTPDLRHPVVVCNRSLDSLRYCGSREAMSTASGSTCCCPRPRTRRRLDPDHALHHRRPPHRSRAERRQTHRRAPGRRPRWLADGRVPAALRGSGTTDSVMTEENVLAHRYGSAGGHPPARRARYRHAPGRVRGSSAFRGRGPIASINFVAAHDGSRPPT